MDPHTSVAFSWFKLVCVNRLLNHCSGESHSRVCRAALLYLGCSCCLSLLSCTLLAFNLFPNVLAALLWLLNEFVSGICFNVSLCLILRDKWVTWRWYRAVRRTFPKLQQTVNVVASELARGNCSLRKGTDLNQLMEKFYCQLRMARQTGHHVSLLFGSLFRGRGPWVEWRGRKGCILAGEPARRVYLACGTAHL